MLTLNKNDKKLYCSRMMPMNGMGNMMPTAESNIIQGLNYNAMGLSISENQEYLDIFHGTKKKDDLSDALLQGLWLISTLKL